MKGEVTVALADNITPEERRNPENYTPVLNAPFYPFENPYANGGAWNIPGSDGKEHVLKIDYAFGDEPRTGLVHMPAVERNTYYTICCLMRNDSLQNEALASPTNTSVKIGSMRGLSTSVR